MIFKNRKAYVVNRISENETNNESYDLDVTKDFIFEATFNLIDKIPNEGESCIISREGYNMGFYLYNFEGDDFIIGQYNFENSMIDKYSKFFHFKGGIGLKGRIFKNNKVMIYSKNTNIDYLIKDVLSKFRDIYNDIIIDPINFENPVTNAIFSFKIKFTINFNLIYSF